MSRGIFIAGNESGLCRAVEAETAKRADNYTVALIQNRLPGAHGTAAPANDKRILLDWNPSSPISARTLVLAAENRMEKIDEAILVCSPPSIRSSAAELPFAEVEIMINDHIKGWFFLVKELAVVFSIRKQGTLSLVYNDTDTKSGKDDMADIPGPVSLACFRALTQGLLTAAHSDPYTTMGFSCTDAGNEAGFASFVYKNIDEGNKRSNGKLFRFGKFNLFK